jgi:hypothetical protein
MFPSGKLSPGKTVVSMNQSSLIGQTPREFLHPFSPMFFNLCHCFHVSLDKRILMCSTMRSYLSFSSTTIVFACLNLHHRQKLWPVNDPQIITLSNMEAIYKET